MGRLYWCGLVLLACCCTVIAADTLDERSVDQLMKTVELASARRDVDLLGSQLADDIQVEITVVTDDNTINVEMNKDDYLSSVLQSWSVWDNYRYNREDTRIVVHADHAIATSTVVEEGSLGDEVIRQASSNTATVRKVDGRLLLTRIASRVEL